MVNKNIPNALTIIRIIMSFFIIYLLLERTLTNTIFALILFIIASITDFLDGVIARKYNLISNFGKIADPTADKILTIGAFISFSILNLFSFIWLIPIIIREVGITIRRILNHKKGSSKKIAAKMSGKIKTTTQIITIIIMFINLILKNYYEYKTIENITNITMYIFLSITVILTIYSGIEFLINKGEQ